MPPPLLQGLEGRTLDPPFLPEHDVNPEVGRAPPRCQAVLGGHVTHTRQNLRFLSQMASHDVANLPGPTPRLPKR